jgi:hypothetical protein
MTIEEATAIIRWSAGVHLNFGSNVEARRRYYARRSQAKALLEANGYTLREVHWGYEQVDPDLSTP